MSNYLRRRGIQVYDRLRARTRDYVNAPDSFNTQDRHAVSELRLPGSPEIVLHFPGAIESMYQLAGWIPVLEALSGHDPAMLVVRHPEVFEALRSRTSLPVVYARGYPVLARLIQNTDPKLILYVHHRSENYQSLRFTDQLHVHIGHGESDKVYMASNQAKAYDRVFVAGDAAIDRLEANLLDFDTSALVKVGRPQLDVGASEVSLPARAAILYAPTYEGDIEGMRYTSVDVLGERIVRSVIDAPDLDLVYRPHPLTGRHDPAVREADRRIRTMIDESGNTAVVDTETPFIDLMRRAHLLISDVSAVVVDFLATDRPYMVTDPGHVRAVDDAESALDAGYSVTARTIANLLPMIEEALESDPHRQDRARWRTYYFGNYAPGGSLAAFDTALRCAIVERDRLVDRKRERIASGHSRPRLPDPG